MHRARRGGLFTTALVVLAVGLVALMLVTFTTERVASTQGPDALKRDLVIAQIGGACFLVVFLLVLLRWGVARQTKHAAADIRRLAQDDLATPIDGAGHPAEIATALEALRLSLIERRAAEHEAEARRRDEAAQRGQADAARGAAERLHGALVKLVGAALARLAQGDLTARIRVEVPAEFRPMKDDFNRATEELQWAMLETAQLSGQFAADAGQLSDHSRIVVRRAARQASELTSAIGRLDETAAALDGLAQTACEIETAAATAGEDARLGLRSAGRAGEVMGGLEHVVQEIAAAVEAVDEIAFKTNLLALNAGVEAARAGEAGRGFAVVAAEVRQLAERSAGAAEEVNRLVAALSAGLGDGVRLVEETGGIMERLVSATDDLSARTDTMHGRMREGTVQMEETSTVLHGLQRATDRSAELAGKLAAASARLEEDGRCLEALPTRFRTEPQTARPDIAAEPESPAVAGGPASQSVPVRPTDASRHAMQPAGR
ncbi:methyl-accepting chemotaxis protein [Mesorhizobium xinjiangense]|uniref:methyl-accepting chemotaxis protein n=1 Tax=Mesorhizobium xinjiangense TaxID=2678685 RepID=UPI0018DCC12B|nr:methyl-accepting chemotaxis protein [Mesorhizobium xinjiangense]